MFKIQWSLWLKETRKSVLILRCPSVVEETNGELDCDQQNMRRTEDGPASIVFKPFFVLSRWKEHLNIDQHWQDHLSTNIIGPASSHWQDHLSTNIIGPASSHWQDHLSTNIIGPASSHWQDHLSTNIIGPASSHWQVTIWVPISLVLRPHIDRWPSEYQYHWSCVLTLTGDHLSTNIIGPASSHWQVTIWVPISLVLRPHIDRWPSEYQYHWSCVLTLTGDHLSTNIIGPASSHWQVTIWVPISLVLRPHIDRWPSEYQYHWSCVLTLEGVDRKGWVPVPPPWVPLLKSYGGSILSTSLCSKTVNNTSSSGLGGTKI